MEQVLTISTTWGTNDPTKATIPFHLARGAKQTGVDVRIVLAGDSTDLIRSGVAGTVRGKACRRLKKFWTARARTRFQSTFERVAPRPVGSLRLRLMPSVDRGSTLRDGRA